MKIPCMKKGGKGNSCQIVVDFQWRIVPGSLQAFKSSQYVIYLITAIFARTLRKIIHSVSFVPGMGTLFTKGRKKS